jgi:hypothetical protein
MAGLVPAIPIILAPQCPPKRDARHKAGHDAWRFPDAVQRKTVHRWSGIVENAGFATIPGLQRITYVLRCARETVRSNAA